MKLKSETSSLVQTFVQIVDMQFSVKIKSIKTNNGVEFKLPALHASKGILHQTSCVETPQQNGVLERKH